MKMMVTRLDITGMTCGRCGSRVKAALQDVRGCTSPSTGTYRITDQTIDGGRFVSQAEYEDGVRRREV